MADWLGWDVIEATTAGGSYVGAPWKACLHTTEGFSIASALSAYRSHGGWPHVTVDPGTRERVQHYPLSISSRALAHPKGAPETNRANVINVEIVARAAHIRDLPADQLAWLGTEVVRPICEARGIPLSTSVEWVAYPSSYGLGASQRLTWADWAGYSGVLAHEHVPGNDHGDAGALDIATILTAANGDDMTRAELEEVLNAAAGVGTTGWADTVRVTLDAARQTVNLCNQLGAHVAALAQQVDDLQASGGTVDIDALAAKVADLLAARLSS